MVLRLTSSASLCKHFEDIARLNIEKFLFKKAQGWHKASIPRLDECMTTVQDMVYTRIAHWNVNIETCAIVVLQSRYFYIDFAILDPSQ